MVTKGSSFIFEGNSYLVVNDTPFEPSYAGILADKDGVGTLGPPQQQQQHQKQKAQRQDEEDDNILGNGVYEQLTGAVCFFRDGENNPIGTGFAVSASTVYSVAHNFLNPAVGMEVTCHFGKPNQRLIRRL